MSINGKGVCGYCLGAKETIKPVNNDPKEAEKNNFYREPCEVCGGTGKGDFVLDDCCEDDEYVSDNADYAEYLNMGDEDDEDNDELGETQEPKSDS